MVRMSAPKRMGALQAMGVGKEPLSPKEEDALMKALLQDESDVVRHEAAFLLGHLRGENRLPSYGQVLQSLLKAANDTSILVRHEVALALANFEAESVMPVLLTLHLDAALEVRSSAEFALQELMETVETVSERASVAGTWLKLGVNERGK